LSQAQVLAVRAALNAEMANLTDVKARQAFKEAYNHFEGRAALPGYDAFALKETWTDRDTDLMHKWDGPKLDTKATRKELPTVSDLPFMGKLAPGGAVMVGNAAGAHGKRHSGEWIDSHDTVIRFNQYSHQGDNWGTKITQHAVNAFVEWCCNQSVPLVDLEISAVSGEQVFPRRFQEHRRQPIFWVRPVANLKTSREATRGLLYFLLMGRYYPCIHMIGFSGVRDVSSRMLVHETGLLFEHALWRALHAQGLISLADAGEHVEERHQQLRRLVTDLAVREAMLARGGKV